jgi:ornithine carbamoyltransferase
VLAKTLAEMDDGVITGRPLRLGEFDAESLAELLDLAEDMRAHPRDHLDRLRGETLVCLFDTPASYTRLSFPAAAARLGMSPLVLCPEDLQHGLGETIGDAGRVLSRYAVGIVADSFSEPTLEALAAATTVPVINARCDQHHPVQVLADLLTIRRRFDDLDGRRITFVGDGAGSVCRSLIEIAAVCGMHVTVACPPTHAPADDVVAHAADVGHAPVVTADLEGAIVGADVVCTDVWVSMRQGGERDARLGSLRPYQVTPGLMRTAAVDAMFLHCLPAHRGLEVTAGVIDGPQSYVFDQAETRLWAAQALIALRCQAKTDPTSRSSRHETPQR